MAFTHDMLVELQEVVHSFSGRTCASKRQLQQLAGKLIGHVGWFLEGAHFFDA